MKQKVILILLLFLAIVTKAETLLIIQPLTGEEQANALAQIGYVKVTTDSLFVYSHGNILLGKNAIKEIRHIRYRVHNETPTNIDDVVASTIRIYPNPTQDMLIIENPDAEKALIFDLNGRHVLTVPLYGEEATINVTSLPKGEYLLLLNTQTFKFIKQ